MPFLFKTLRYSFCACLRNILKIVTFAIEKMKLASFSLFLDASPPRPKMPFGQLNVAIQIYNICKGLLGSRGGGGGGGGGEGVVKAKEDIKYLTKNRPLCKMVVFIVHQLYK